MYMYIAFFSTSDVFAAEELCQERGIFCEVVPTPVTDRAYCGVCLKVAKGIDEGFLGELEYQIIGEGDYVQIY